MSHCVCQTSLSYQTLPEQTPKKVIHSVFINILFFNEFGSHNPIKHSPAVKCLSSRHSCFRGYPEALQTPLLGALVGAVEPEPKALRPLSDSHRAYSTENKHSAQIVHADQGAYLS